MEDEVKQTIILDFDGVVHSYTSGWKGAAVIPDPPTPQAKEAIAELRRTYNVVIVSSRCHQPGGVQAIRDWLALHGIEVDDVTNDKPPHIVTVDDRAFRFEGDWQAVIYGIEAASIPWNKKESSP
jgi:HAD domain in Swiss Army Knife RNA repair proteins